MADIVPSDNSASPAFKIMRRSANDKLNRKGRSGSADADSDGSDAGSSGLSKKRRNMTIAEREAAYNEARSRIFSTFDDRDEAVSANSSNHSLSSVPSAGDRTPASPDDESKASESPISRTSSKGGNKRNAGKDRWNDLSRSSTSNFDPDFDRASFSYPTIYEQHPPNGFDAPYVLPAHAPHSDEQSYVSPHYAMYPPYPTFPPPYMAPFPVYYDPRHYGYPPHPPPPLSQGSDGVAAGNGAPGAPPFAMYPPGMAGWYPQPLPAPMSSAPPNALNTNPALQIPQHAMMPGNQQQLPPPPLPQLQQLPGQAPYFNPVAPPFYPPRFPIANHDPNGFAQTQQQQSPQPHANSVQQPHTGLSNHAAPGALYSPSDDTKSMGPGPSRFNSSSRGSSRSSVRDATGTSAGRMRPPISGSSPGPRNPPQLPRNPWSYGSGGSGLGIPMAVGSSGRKTGSSSSRAGSVSSRSGSNGAMTPADETGSIAVSGLLSWRSLTPHFWPIADS